MPIISAFFMYTEAAACGKSLSRHVNGPPGIEPVIHQTNELLSPSIAGCRDKSGDHMPNRTDQMLISIRRWSSACTHDYHPTTF